MWQNKRSNEKELLDLGPSYYTALEYDDCLKKLERINSLLGGFRAMKKAVMGLMPCSILDIGCGGGSLCQQFAKWFEKADIVGIDINPQAIEYAKAHLPESLKKRVLFKLSSHFSPASFDVVTSVLLTHHLSDDELIDFLKTSFNLSKKALIINDLQRHILAYISFSVIAPFLFRNRLIWNDGRLSIKRGFRKKEWLFLLEKAGFNKDQYTIRWNWAFRWTIIIRRV